MHEALGLLSNTKNQNIINIIINNNINAYTKKPSLRTSGYGVGGLGRHWAFETRASHIAKCSTTERHPEFSSQNSGSLFPTVAEHLQPERSLLHMKTCKDILLIFLRLFSVGHR